MLVFVCAAPPQPVLDSQQKSTVSSKSIRPEDALSNPGNYEEIGRKLKGDFKFSYIYRSWLEC